MDGKHVTSQMMEILVVEDNEDDIELTQLAFESARVVSNLYVTRDGVEALQFLRHDGPFVDAARPDLILLDLNMPRMDGRELLSILKSDDDLKRIPAML